MSLLRLIEFIMTEMFPGGQPPGIDTVRRHATRTGFSIDRVQSLQRHCAKTLDLWAAAVQEHQDDAIALQSDELYQRYMKHLTGCADLFRGGYTDVCQITLKKR
jgi:cyclopropane-fatty-acyl-phospholipid synthase